MRLRLPCRIFFRCVQICACARFVQSLLGVFRGKVPRVVFSSPARRWTLPLFEVDRQTSSRCGQNDACGKFVWKSLVLWRRRRSFLLRLYVYIIRTQNGWSLSVVSMLQSTFSSKPSLICTQRHGRQGLAPNPNLVRIIFKHKKGWTEAMFRSTEST